MNSSGIFLRLLSGMARNVRPAFKPLLSLAESLEISTQRSATFSRSLWYLTRDPHNKPIGVPKGQLLLGSHPCGCGCGCSGIHTKGDKELVQFLGEEISNEKQAQKGKIKKIEGFEIKTDVATITLTKQYNNENIKVTLNVNHSVDAEVTEPEENPSEEKPDEMTAKPNFLIEIQKGSKTLAFNCSFIQSFDPNAPIEGDHDAYDDVFNIDEFSIYEGERNEKTYAVAGEIMDGHMYDLFMNYLEERGLSNEFAENLSTYATSHEHKLYIGLLEGLKSFVSSN